MKDIKDLGRIIPVIKIEDASKAGKLGKALAAGGIKSAEITFRSDAALDAIKKMAEEVPEIIVGAGTVVNAEQAKAAVKAGAKFIVSPGFDEETVRWCLSEGISVLPGVVTPTEIMKAMALGLTTLKFFPAEASGGIPMLKSLAGPFPGIKFMPTGGINKDNLQDYLKLKNVEACGGSWLCTDKLLKEDNYEEIERLCREAVALCEAGEA